MKKRHIAHVEQPYRLIEELMDATVLHDDQVAPEVATAERRGLFGWLPLRKKQRRTQKLPAVANHKGVPHGVVDAIVYARGVRVDAYGRVFFCQSHDYVVLNSTIKGDDGNPYPPDDHCLISTRKLPRPDFYTARMRVSVNGSVNVHIEAFDVPMPEVSEMSMAGV